MSWVSIPKPTGTPYTEVTLNDNILYDQSTITYDSSTTLYDGFISGITYTNIAKPTGSVYTLISKPI